MSCHSKKLFIIYKTTYLPTKKIYIGQHKVKNERTLDPWYVGSGSEIEDLQNKDKRKLGGYWRKLYKREVLAKIKTNDIRVVNNIEVFYILKFDSTNPAIGYNIIDRATIFDVERMDERVKKKIIHSMDINIQRKLRERCQKLKLERMFQNMLKMLFQGLIKGRLYQMKSKIKFH